MPLTKNALSRSGEGVLIQHLLYCHWDFERTAENWYVVSNMHSNLLKIWKEEIFLAEIVKYKEFLGDEIEAGMGKL